MKTVVNEKGKAFRLGIANEKGKIALLVGGKDTDWNGEERYYLGVGRPEDKEVETFGIFYGPESCKAFFDKFNGLMIEGTGRETYTNGEPDVVEAGGWISVADRIPVEDEEVLVVTKSKNGKMNIDKGYVLDGRWIHRGTAKVIFWQPFPELPREETK